MATKALQNKISKIIVTVIVVFFIFSLIMVIFPATFGASNGAHTGVVTAVEYNSNLVWGANIVYFKTVRESSQEDLYCVNDENVKAQLIEAQKEKKEVTVYFKNNYLMWKWECNGGASIIYQVE